MRSEHDLEELNAMVIERIIDSDIKKAAIAVSGSENSLVVLHAAACALGKENVVALTADTGHIEARIMDISELACTVVGVEYRVIPIQSFDDEKPDTYEYKHSIFSEMLHEAWLLGFDNIICACTEFTRSDNGNQAIFEFGSVYCPLCANG